jgi:hypothetical protein
MTTTRLFPAIGRALAAFVLLAGVAACASPGGASSAPAPAVAGGAGVSSGMRDMTSVQLSREMVPGINLGNTMEAIPNGEAKDVAIGGAGKGVLSGKPWAGTLRLEPMGVDLLDPAPKALAGVSAR